MTDELEAKLVKYSKSKWLDAETGRAIKVGKEAWTHPHPDDTTTETETYKAYVSGQAGENLIYQGESPSLPKLLTKLIEKIAEEDN